MTTSPDALAWIETTTGSAVRSTTLLDGATTATVERIDLDDGRRLVSKRFDRQDILDERPERALHEAAVLDLLELTAVPVPRLVAVDGDGSQAGVPTVLMSWVEGTTRLPDDWVHAMAANLADIHAVAPGPITWEYERYNEGFELIAPVWATDPEVWADAFVIASAAPPATTVGFIHRDYHGGNLLWKDGRLAAVLDWLSGCVGPPAADLAHLRVNLAMDHGMDAADTVLGAYHEVGSDDAWHSPWDVISAIDFVPFYEGQRAVEGWRWDARPAAETQARFDRFLTAAVARVTSGDPT